MTNISGSVLRAVADWYDTQDGTDVLVSRLRDDAEKMDVDEKRLDRLACIFWNGQRNAPYGGDAIRAWIEQPEQYRAEIRAGIRAVLAAIDDQVDVEIVDDEPRQWDRIEDVPVVVKVVDLKGRKWRHFAEGWMVWTRDDWMLPWHENRNKFAPFTEVVDGAQ